MSFRAFAQDKIWVITGAGAGIGLEMARHVLAARGVVWALDRSADALLALSAEAERSGWDVFTRIVDVTDQAAMCTVIAEVLQVSKRLNVWINNAGIQRVGSFTSMPEDEFDWVMRVNMTSVINLTRVLIKTMENQGGGVILNMASVAGHVPAPYMSAYVASKHAVVGFTRAVQAELELQDSLIRVAYASPGFVETAIVRRGHDEGFPEWLSWMLADAKRCAREILTDLAGGRTEIQPTLNGAMMTAAYKILPKMTVRSSRLLLTRGIKDVVLNRIHPPR